MRLLLAVVMLVGFAVPRAHAQSFGLFSYPDCSSCNLAIPVGGTGTFYVRALTGHWEHILGAELRIVGLPPDWHVVSVTPNPNANVLLGDVMGAGVNIAFPSDQDGDCIDLFTIVIYAPTPATEVALRVTRHTTPSNPQAACPRFVPNCWRAPDKETQCFVIACATGGTLFINSSTTCTVGVQQSTWSAMKQLYER